MHADMTEHMEYCLLNSDPSIEPTIHYAANSLPNHSCKFRVYKLLYLTPRLRYIDVVLFIEVTVKRMGFRK